MKIENLEQAFEEMFEFITDLPSGLDGFESDFETAFEELEKVQSNNVQEVKHGKWSKEMLSHQDPVFESFHFGFQCSVCGALMNKTAYCGNCGAKMNKKDGE